MFSIFIYIAVAVILLLVLVWLAGITYLNDFSVHSMKLPHDKRVLVIFPHPDDETNIAGTLWRLARRHCHVTLAVLTEGEYGTPDAHFEPSLGARRRQEMQRVAKILNAKKVIQENFGDGQLAKQEKTLALYLQKLLADEQPDIVISYDLAGLYGHPDHIACAEALHAILKRNHPHIDFWYSAWPTRMLDLSRFPEHMATDPHFKQKRATANARVFTGFGVVPRIRAVYAHKSQRQSFKDNAPGHIPIWFVQSLQIFEYYERVQ